MKTCLQWLICLALVAGTGRMCQAAAVETAPPQGPDAGMADVPHDPDAQGCCQPHCCMPRVKGRKTLYVGDGVLEVTVNYKGLPADGETILLILYDAGGNMVFSRTYLPENRKETYRLEVDCDQGPHTVTVWCTPGPKCFQTRVVSGECS